MFTSAMGRDDAAFLVAVFAKAEYDLTAGAGTDAAEQTAATLDLRDGFGARRYQSGAAIIAATATLAEAKTLNVTAVWEHSADGATWTEIGVDQTVLTLIGPVGGATVTGSGKLGVNLAEADGFVRVKFTPDLSATGTDTAKVSSVYLLLSPDQI